MYNQERKTEYIAALERNEEYKNRLDASYNVWFKKAESFENKYKKDLADFNVSEIVTFYHDGIKTASLSYVFLIHGYMKEYATYCNGEKHHYNDITTDLMKLCVDKDKEKSRIIIRKDLIRELESFDNSFEQALVLGLFEGIKIADFDYLDMTNVDENTQIVHLHNREFKISQLLIDYIKKSCETYEVFHNTNNQNINNTRYFDFDRSDRRVIKQTQFNANAKRIMRYRTIMRSCREKYGYEWLSISSLPQSGAASMLLDLWQKEKEENGSSVKEVAKKHLSEIQLRYGVSWVYKEKFRSKYGFLFNEEE